LAKSCLTFQDSHRYKEVAYVRGIGCDDVSSGEGQAAQNYTSTVRNKLYTGTGCPELYKYG